MNRVDSDRFGHANRGFGQRRLSADGSTTVEIRRTPLNWALQTL